MRLCKSIDAQRKCRKCFYRCFKGYTKKPLGNKDLEVNSSTSK